MRSPTLDSLQRAPFVPFYTGRARLVKVRTGARPGAASGPRLIGQVPKDAFDVLGSGRVVQDAHPDGVRAVDPRRGDEPLAGACQPGHEARVDLVQRGLVVDAGRVPA